MKERIEKKANTRKALVHLCACFYLPPPSFLKKKCSYYVMPILHLIYFRKL